MNLLKTGWVKLSGKKTFWSSLVGVLYLLAVSNGLVGYDQDIVNAIQAGVSVGLVHKLIKFILKTS